MGTISIILLCLNMGIQNHDGMVDNVGEDYLNNGFSSFTIERSGRWFKNINNTIPVITSTLSYKDHGNIVLISETVTEEDNEYLDGDYMSVKSPKDLK